VNLCVWAYGREFGVSILIMFTDNSTAMALRPGSQPLTATLAVSYFKNWHLISVLLCADLGVWTKESSSRLVTGLFSLFS
jgi:hypothetical protein